MKVYSEFDLYNFEPWSGAVDTKDIIIEHGKAEEFNTLVDELFSEGASETDINDLLWFEDDWLFETLGIEIEE